MNYFVRCEFLVRAASEEDAARKLARFQLDTAYRTACRLLQLAGDADADVKEIDIEIIREG